MQALVDHLPALRRYARLLTGDPTRADDLVQDTLERALRKWSLFQRPGRLRHWLLAVMHNLWASQCRATPQEVEWIEGHDSGVDSARHTAQRIDIERALLRLPDAHRAVLLLVVIEDLSYAEVAQVLDIPIGTVMSRLSRARASLRDMMAPAGDAPTAAAPALRVVTRS